MNRLPRVSLVLLSFFAIFLFGAAARADIILHANLTHDQEVVAGPLLVCPPANAPCPGGSIPGSSRPLSFGTATFIIDTAVPMLTMSVTVFNIDITGTQTPDDLNDNLVAAHIHVGAPPGANAPVRWGFIGAPDNDNNPDNLVVTPFASGVGGTFTSVWDDPEGNAGTTLTSNLPAILAGLSYINFHTVQFPGGEIRGQIVPEPATLALMGLGLLGLRLRRKFV